MTAEQKQAYEWAKNQSYQSVAARYAKELCGVIDALQAENAEKDKEIVKLKLEKELMRQEWDTLHAALSRVEAERDAAKRDIESILRSCTCEVRHEFCARCDEPGGCDSDDCHDAEWRGAQGEG